ncbi:MAG TPA: helix-turn-helix domain-containing protein [Phenylobacterium sp.]|nr:helix-turn-helix domain-containing protein [Phenylobacterium sp.]
MRSLLRMAALELFRERGYDGTTAAEIAARIGVTERTFFRHFPDKREVLFAGETEFHAALGAAIAAAPDGLSPLQVLLWAFKSIQQMFLDNRAFAEPAQEIIARTPALRERQLGKTASTIALMAAALERRCVEPNLATLAAGAGMAIFGHAAQAWTKDPAVDLGVHLERALQSLQGLSGGGGAQSHQASGEDRRRMDLDELL